VTKQEILETLGPIRQSTIKTWLNCPLMMKYRYLDDLEPSFRHPAALHGSSLHLVLYWLHTESWHLDTSEMYRKAYNHYEFASEEEHIPVRWDGDRSIEIEKLSRNAVEILEGYRSKNFNKQATVLFAETPFKVRILGYEFTGTIDQVRKNPDGSIELVDFKSSKLRPNPYALAADWQLSLYTYALRFGELEVDGQWVTPRILADHSTWYHLRMHEKYKRKTGNAMPGDEKGHPLLRSSRTLEELRHFRSEVANLVKVMSKDWSFPNPSSCAFCSYTQHCAARAQVLSDHKLGQAHELLTELEMEEA